MGTCPSRKSLKAVMIKLKKDHFSRQNGNFATIKIQCSKPGAQNWHVADSVIGKFVIFYICEVENQWYFYNTFKIELTTCLEKKNLLKMHLLILFGCYSLGKYTKYETCTKLHRFHIHYIIIDYHKETCEYLQT